MSNTAVCITLGEQSENHAGMACQGSGLAEHGFCYDDLYRIWATYEQMGGITEFYDLGCLLTEEQATSRSCPSAYVLVLRDSLTFLCDIDPGDVLKEMTRLDWDTQYWDTRRQKVLNKHARHNLCFGEEAQEPDYANKKGRIVPYTEVPLMNSWKVAIEKLCRQSVPLEAEGNLYYDAKKCGIGWHGDSERKKVVALNLNGPDVHRQIHWRWYMRNEPFGDRLIVDLGAGDSYIMSEVASGYNWKRSSIPTLRHAAVVRGSKYLA